MKKVVIKDVAKHVGVSSALVSYVLNGKAVGKKVNKETAKRIRLAAKELNYHPNQIAKSLRLQHTHTIGLIVADINYRFTSGITSSIELEAKKNKYTVIYGSSNEDKGTFRELITVFINRNVDGLIVVPVERSQRDIKMLQKWEVPFLLIDRYFPEIKTNYIALDNYKAAYKATEYLIKTKHKRIAIINIDTSLFHLLERTRGYMDALKDNGIVFESSWIQKVDNSNMDNSVQSSIDSILSSRNRFDAIFFATDTIAIHGLKYLLKKDIKVPEDISVLSFDESEVFDLFKCPITHSRQPLEEMGKIAVSTLIQLINHKEINMQISLNSELIKGKSCGEK